MKELTCSREDLVRGEIDVEGYYLVDRDDNVAVKYIGKAKRQLDGSWICLADVCGSLCRVEVTIRIPLLSSLVGLFTSRAQTIS